MFKYNLSDTPSVHSLMYILETKMYFEEHGEMNVLNKLLIA